MDRGRCAFASRIAVALSTVLLLSYGPVASAQAIARDVFGTLPDGRAVERFRLTNARGTSADLIEFGASIASIRLANPGRPPTEVLVGPDDLAAFTKRRFGQIVGRYAGRLRGEVLIEGVRYPLATNAAGVTVHGGDPGLDRELWRGTPFSNAKGSGVTFKLVSPSGQQGFPGTLTLEARYFLARDSDTLTLDIKGSADRPTFANLTNHVFFNLAGEGTVACHILAADARRYVQIDQRKLPTGALPSVRNTRFDFTKPRLLTSLLRTGGLDDMVVLEPRGAVRLRDLASGRTLKMTTNQPGVQVFTGNGFDGSFLDRGGRPIVRHAGVALEAIGLPDSPWFPQFPSTTVSPKRPLRWHTKWTFSTSPRERGSCSEPSPPTASKM